MDRFVRSADQETAPVSDGSVIMHVPSGTAYSLNAVGACVWDRLDTPRTLDELCAAVRERFDVPDARCREDVSALLADLERNGLLSRGS